ncbi:MAG: response regulator [Rhodospirillales bacterium]
MVGQKSLRNVLVVEDDQNTRDIVSRVLDKEACRVTMSLSMEDALLGFEQMPFELVIADIFMTGMGGIKGIQRMREVRPEMKTLAMSAGYSDMSPNAALKAAEKIGADAVLTKPFSLNELRELVTGLLDEGQDGD